MVLENIYTECIDAEKEFKNRAVLFIGSESYDAATVTVMEGLQDLGFTVYTLGRPNINSWFVNTVVDVLPGPVDFTLSNLHWGTQWAYYQEWDIPRPWVLIDGDDEYWGKGWRWKYENYLARYKGGPLPRSSELYPCRWVEPLGDYEPDVLFVSQKQRWQQDAYYLPFGITREYLDAARWLEPTIDFLHIPGAGRARQAAHNLITAGRIPGVARSHSIQGQREFPEGIRALAQKDRNIHSYHRWGICQDYFDTLSKSWVLIYPNIDGPQWDSKRPYEALACGCVLLIKQPPTDMSSYPLPEILGDDLIYQDEDDLIEKCNDLYYDKEMRAELAYQIYRAARRYFTPKPLARYVLRRIHDSGL